MSAVDCIIIILLMAKVDMTFTEITTTPKVENPSEAKMFHKYCTLSTK